MTLQDEWDLRDLRNEKPERLARCDNCGRLFEESEGCECWPEEEAELA